MKPTPKVMPAPKRMTRKISDVLDQHDDSTFEALSPAELSECRQRFVKIMGDHPPDAHRPSNDQLAALVHRMRTGLAPLADFAVFKPYGHRHLKKTQISGPEVGRRRACHGQTSRAPEFRRVARIVACVPQRTDHDRSGGAGGCGCIRVTGRLAQ